MKESDIRPAAIFDKFLDLAEKDISTFFGGHLENFCCPACGHEGDQTFVKHGFAYRECPECKTLFVSPRPTAEAFSRYYQESESAKYWASNFYKETAEARREKLWRPKALMILELLKRFGTIRHKLIDIGGGYGIFAEEYANISGDKVAVIEPGPALAHICRDKGLEVIQEFLENITQRQLGDGAKTFVSFELFEHLHNPKTFLRHLFQLMSAGDLFIFTTLSGTGVDIQALWDNSKSVSPPHHLNFLNPKSAHILLEHIGFKVLQTSTPGKLDIDILQNNQNHIKDRFWRTFIAQATEEEKNAMQLFIADHGLSSHMLIVCQKP